MNEIQKRSLEANKLFIENHSDEEINNMMAEFDNYEPKQLNKHNVMRSSYDWDYIMIYVSMIVFAIFWLIVMTL